MHLRQVELVFDARIKHSTIYLQQCLAEEGFISEIHSSAPLSLSIVPHP